MRNRLGEQAIIALIAAIVTFTGVAASSATYPFELSRAGYWAAKGSPRLVRSMDPGWEFSLDAFKTSKAVNLPHSIDEGEIGLEASGGVNRRTQAWYRKTFDWQKSRAKSFLHFEGIMGKSRVTINGLHVAEHFGGFLPIHVDVTDVLTNGANTVEVWCDNSDDPSYPPGKAQDVLDWTYFGGIYRDCWLVETGEAYVADSDKGGVYVTSRLEADGSWTVAADVTLGGLQDAQYELFYDGERVTSPFKPRQPALWTPDEPNLHTLEVRVSKDGRETDAVAVRFGIRDFVMDERGLTLNGKSWRKLIGVNRHQDFAFVGMALANSLHVRDVMKYRAAGFTVVRNAHYPQDPAFMDACDALGMFVIENPPGWQFWNSEDPRFATRVYNDIQKMVRRDRSRASLLMWEPILNETSYPVDFAHRAREIVRSETRAPNYCACDLQSQGSDEYDVIYSHRPLKDRPKTPWFTREWGDFPDDWNAQNSVSRVPVEWGETPMLLQAEHYTTADYAHNISYYFRQEAACLGGCLWHGADHSRGYHPDNFFGGILTYTRRPKYSYHACKAMLTDAPYVYLAHQLSPVSPMTFTIYSNCTYRATYLGREIRNGDAFDRVGLKRKAMACAYPPNGTKLDPRELDFVLTLADGTSVTNRHAGRFARIELACDTEGWPILGDGSDLVACTALMCDAEGRPRHYQSENVRFAVEGAAQIVGENPQRTRWGEATVLIRPLAPGEIRVTASPVRAGVHLPQPGVLTFVAESPKTPTILGYVTPQPSDGGVTRDRALVSSHAVDLSEVERQQQDFGMKMPSKEGK